jgi:anti-anti-sigma factor
MRGVFGFRREVVCTREPFFWRERTLEITRRFVGRVAVLDLTGCLTVSSTEVEILPLRAALSGLIAEGHIDVALNLVRVTHIDARYLGELVFMLTTLRRLGGHLTLVAPPDRVSKMLSVTRLDGLFDGCDGEADLVAKTRSATRRRIESLGLTAYA